MPENLHSVNNAGDTRKPVDAVITWVDGTDPAHRNKLEKRLAQVGRTPPKSVGGSRLVDAGELALCVASLLKNAPWIRTVYIVTDNQTPSFLDAMANPALRSKIQVVDHKAIFEGYEEGLPSFNTRSISMLLWKIKGLSEHFLYLNDDFFIIRPVETQDFFRDGKIVTRGHWKYLYSIKVELIRFLSRFIETFRHKHAKPGYLKSQYYAAKAYSLYYRFMSVDHAPHAMSQHYFSSFFQQHAEHARHLVSFPFRSVQQISAESLSVHAAHKDGNLVLDTKNKTMIIHAFDSPAKKIQKQLAIAEQNANIAFLCIQDLAGASESVQTTLRDWLENQMLD